MSGEFLMKILALEFSSPQRSVAIVQRDERTDELHASPHLREPREARGARPSAVSVSEVVETGGRTNTAFKMIDEALREAALEREQIECIAVGTGPGSYTGIRAAISIVQGWQLARGTRILAISSAEAIAAEAQVDGMIGRVNVVVDAQRGEFYLATYELARNGYREIEALKIVTMAEVRQRAEAGGALIGPEVSRSFPLGKTVFPRATTLGTLALNRTDFMAGEKLEPIYLRETTFVKAPPPRIFS
jgi:tRNA threonylcarbamoyl adenosine modification protein YeaZ